MNKKKQELEQPATMNHAVKRDKKAKMKSFSKSKKVKRQKNFIGCQINRRAGTRGNPGLVKKWIIRN